MPDAAFMADCRQLCSSPHRLAGTAQGAAAVDYVVERLAGLGPDTVIVQPFPLMQTRVVRCEASLFAGDSAAVTVPLQPMRPNGITPPVTPPEGLGGRVRYLGDGSVDCFGVPSLEGCVAVLNYNSRAAWLRAMRLGARAVIFVRSGVCEAWHPHFADGNANIPRFFYDGPADDLLIADSVVVHSSVVWESAVGRNVFAVYRGTDPVFQLDAEEVIVIASDLDSYGEVPRLSPGARGAANCAALLQLARRLQHTRPRRHVVLAFFDAHARNHEGATRFYVAQDSDDPNVKVEDRDAYLRDEEVFTEELLAAVAVDRVGQVDTPAGRDVMDRLKQCATRYAYELKDQMMDRRLALKRDTLKLLDSAAVRQEIDSLDGERVSWNDVRRAIGQRSLGEADPAKLEVVRREVESRIRARKAELVLERASWRADSALASLVRDRWLSLHVSLSLGDRSGRWGVLVGGDSPSRAPGDEQGLYGRIQAGFLSAARELDSAGHGLTRFEVSSVDGSLGDPRSLVAAPYLTHSGEVGGNYSFYNMVVSTVQEDLAREGTPDDILAELDSVRFAVQADEALRLLLQVAGSEHLSVLRGFPRNKWYGPIRFVGTKLKAPQVMATSRGSNVPNVPTAGAVTQHWFLDGETPWYRVGKPYGFDEFYVRGSDANGSFFAGPVMRTKRGYAASFDAYGRTVMASSGGADWSSHHRFNIYACRPAFLVLPPVGEPGAVRVYDGRANGELQSSKSTVKTFDGIVYWTAPEDVEQIKLFNVQSAVCLVNGPDTIDEYTRERTDPNGLGLSADNWVPPVAAPRSACDLWRLNESRLQVLRDKNVVARSLEELHGRSEDLLVQAKQAVSAIRAEALATSAFMIEQTVYTLSRRTLDDLVRAVLVLLALAVPFAFAMERLVIGSAIIFKQLLWFVIFFLLTFFILYLTHPAFGISAVPVVIFLGFAVVTLSALVIVILMRRFEGELKKLQGMTTTVHGADVSRFGTVMAAMNMGISTMRRRPLRTALTAITIVLLTFTILCFASFGSRLGVLSLFVRQPPGYNGVFVHKVDWQPLGRDLLDVVSARWPKADVCPRMWVAPRKKEGAGVLVSRCDGSEPVVLKGVLGIDSTELRHREDLAGVLVHGDSAYRRTVWMTSAVSGMLDVAEGDTVLVGGVPLQVGRLFDAHELLQIQDMDNSDILPVNFAEMAEAQAEEGVAVGSRELGDFAGLKEAVSWTTLPVDLSIVVPAEVAAVLGADLHALAVYTRSVSDARGIAEDLARMLLTPVCGTREDGAYNHVFGPVVKASGLRGLVFPILLGGLVIFGTMLGSVSDREKEIYSYTALGLAPPHVAGLFFAEALVYAVVGGMGGYLTAQGLMKVLGIFAEYGLVTVPDLNYSSSNAVVTILLVMTTVLVSTIYPAIKASRSANPGVMRYWRMPQPEGDNLDIVFPFTVSTYDFTGVVSFLKEHFDLFAETGLGVFMARDTAIRRTEEDSLALTSRLALAPFDLGVTQSFELSSVPGRIEGIEQVKIRISRLSGQPRDWYRLNKVLLAELRKQFLIWRSLAPSTMETYRARTLDRLGERGQGNGEPRREA